MQILHTSFVSTFPHKYTIQWSNLECTPEICPNGLKIITETVVTVVGNLIVFEKWPLD